MNQVLNTDRIEWQPIRPPTYPGCPDIKPSVLSQRYTRSAGEPKNLLHVTAQSIRYGGKSDQNHEFIIMYIFHTSAIWRSLIPPKSAMNVVGKSPPILFERRMLQSIPASFIFRRNRRGLRILNPCADNCSRAPEPNGCPNGPRSIHPVFDRSVRTVVGNSGIAFDKGRRDHQIYPEGFFRTGRKQVSKVPWIGRKGWAMRLSRNQNVLRYAPAEGCQHRFRGDSSVAVSPSLRKPRGRFLAVRNRQGSE